MEISIKPDAIITLPWPPSINGYWRSIVKKGKPCQIISEKGRSFRSEGITAIIDQGFYGKGLSQRLAVKITLFPPDKRKRDVDNFNKATFDALTHAKFWKDDEQVDKLVIVRGDVVRGGKVVVCVWKINKGDVKC